MRTPLFAIGACAMLLATTSLIAQSAKVLHSFDNNGTDGYNAGSTPIFGKNGNLFGTTLAGGSYNRGMIFELAPRASGDWTEKILFNFNGYDGDDPLGNLTFDASGNLYGTTVNGGDGWGTVYELLRQTAGGWTEKILYNLQSGPSGQCPAGGVVFDKKGNLYGTAVEESCGHGDGVAFELSPEAGGGWAKKTIHVFIGKPTDGKYPGQLAIDSSGNLYGPTEYGGDGVNCSDFASCGTIFELTQGVDGSWDESVLHNFSNDGTDGYYPFGNLTLDASGNVYGTTGAGGAYNKGTVFELSFSSGVWTERILYSFEGIGPDGGLVFDAAGNLYGTTAGGGITDLGTIFELSPSSGGTWVGKVIYRFTMAGALGYFPDTPLTIDTSGNLYGATENGGAYGFGTVFEFTP